MSCPDCFSGHQHEGQPVGKMIKLHGLDTYLAEPPEGREARGIIVLIPDAFGIEFVNNKLLADTYARKGDYKVYLPDFMLGQSNMLDHKCRPIFRVLTREPALVSKYRSVLSELVCR